MFQESRKQFWGRIDRKFPRRRRKVYVDENVTADKLGRIQKTFSYFVLPFFLAEDAPWTPNFTLPTNGRKSKPKPKSKLQTLALITSDKPGGSASNDPSKKSVIYLTKADPPPFPHLLKAGS